jgi:hypothetical protein
MFQKTPFKDKCAVVTSYNPLARDVTLEETGANTETDKQFIYNTYTELLKDPKRHRKAAHRNDPSNPSIRLDLGLAMESGWRFSPHSLPSGTLGVTDRMRPCLPGSANLPAGRGIGRWTPWNWGLPFHAKGRTHPIQTTARTDQCHSDGHPE